MSPFVRTLESGFLFVYWSRECWVQLPPNYNKLVIADEFIFHPEWNREKVHAWWQEHRQ